LDARGEVSESELFGATNCSFKHLVCSGILKKSCLPLFNPYVNCWKKLKPIKKGLKIIEQNANPLNTLQAEKFILLLTWWCAGRSKVQPKTLGV